MTKIFKENGVIESKDEIGSASIIKISVPQEILDELEINHEFHIFLVLTCAHNIAFEESMTQN